MRTDVISTDVFTFAELSPAAQERAVEILREKLGGVWWDQHDNDSVAAAMLYSLASALGTPAHGNHSEDDFPGIDGVRLDGWSLDRGQCIAVSGHLDRGNAPGLPWVNGISHVTLTGRRSDYTLVWVEDDDEPVCTCDETRPPVRSVAQWRTRRPDVVRRAVLLMVAAAAEANAGAQHPDLRFGNILKPQETAPPCTPTCPTRTSPRVTAEQRSDLEQAVRDAISTAWTAGRDEMEYRTGEEYARDYVAQNDREFTADGDIYD